LAETWFISDLHLDAGHPGTTRAFEAFLAGIPRCTLYILGDLFEAWIGDDDDAPLAGRVRELLRNFTAGGGALFLMHGNRDFLLGEKFCGDTGATLLEDPCVVDLHGKPTLLMHGDSLCSADVEYQAFRREARQPAWRDAVLRRSLEDRRNLAAELRRMSREAQGNRPEDITDVTPAEVERVMVQHGVRRLIHGHTHRPGHHTTAAGDRWVLGDWDGRGTALKVTSLEFQLVDLSNLDISIG